MFLPPLPSIDVMPLDSWVIVSCKAETLSTRSFPILSKFKQLNHHNESSSLHIVWSVDAVQYTCSNIYVIVIIIILYTTVGKDKINSN